MLVEARGKVVSGGVDVSLFAAIAEAPDAVQRASALWARLLRIAQTIEDLPVPTVFAAHGLTLTAAFEISLACDILLAAERASFGLVEIVVGLTPSMGGPQRLAERAGPARARELIFTGERYPAAVLERWNVVNRVLPDDGFAEAARDYARQVAAGPTVAHAATKRLVTTAVRDGVRAADDAVPAVSGALFATVDLPAAVASFRARPRQGGPPRALERRTDGRTRRPALPTRRRLPALRLARRRALTKRERFAEHSRETFDAVLDLSAEIADEHSRRTTSRATPRSRVVRRREGHAHAEVKDALDAFAEAGSARRRHGRRGGRHAAADVVADRLLRLVPGRQHRHLGVPVLTIGNANLLLAHGTDEQIDTYVRPMIEGRFLGTMCLSEPQAGLVAGRHHHPRRARSDDGTYRLFGNKMWISGGDTS